MLGEDVSSTDCWKKYENALKLSQWETSKDRFNVY